MTQRSLGHRVLVVGVGSIGERHLRCLLRGGRCKAVDFVETHSLNREAVASRYPDACGYSSLDSALESAAYTAAIVATPAASHVPVATQLVGSGLHVLIEKPLAVTFDRVADLIEVVARRNAVAAVAYVYRAHPALAAMRDAVLAGMVGQPVEVVAVCGQHFPLYRPAFRETYYASRETGGGAVQDALTHILNAADWLVGPATRVVADAERLVLEGVEVEDTVHVLTRQDRGDRVLCSFSLNQHQAPNETTITVIGTRGTARFEYHASRWRLMTQPGGEWTDQACGPLERDALFIRQADAFLDAIEGKSSPLCTLEEGIATLATQRAILRSLGSGRWESCVSEPVEKGVA